MHKLELKERIGGERHEMIGKMEEKQWEKEHIVLLRYSERSLDI